MLWTLSSSTAFNRPQSRAEDATRIDALLAEAMRGQDRVRNDLRHGVAYALERLSRVIDGPSPTARVNEALTLVYRVLFLRFAESRDLAPTHAPLYRQSYSMTTLCRDALTDGAQLGLWEGLAAATRLARHGCRTSDLVLTAFNGRLFSRSSAPTLERGRPASRLGRLAIRRDEATRDALMALGTRATSAGLETLSFRDLGVEELGAVYERILDLDPRDLADEGARGKERRRRSGRGRHSATRKESGTFYTPRALAEFVVCRTLAPLVSGRLADAILALRVVDPAMGSGAFLVAACRYLAGAYRTRADRRRSRVTRRS